MQCTNNTKNVQGCSFCIFTIPCHCALITNEDHFASHGSSCNDKPTNFTKLHPYLKFDIITAYFFFMNLDYHTFWETHNLFKTSKYFTAKLYYF
jgi:hypothetical protein